MICLKQSPVVITRALCVFLVLLQRLDKTFQKKAGRAVRWFLVIHWFPSFHPQLELYSSSWHGRVHGAAVKWCPVQDRPAYKTSPLPTFQGRVAASPAVLCKHPLCLLVNCRALWIIPLILRGTLHAPTVNPATEKRASTVWLLVLSCLYDLTNLSILYAWETRGWATSSNYLLQKQVVK